jgi:hypothetical protein
MSFKKISAILGIIVLLGSIIGGAIAYDRKKADQCDLDLKADREDFLVMEYRFNQKSLTDEIRIIQRDIWDIEKEFGYDVTRMPPNIAITYKQLKFQLEQFKEKLRQIRKGK